VRGVPSSYVSISGGIAVQLRRGDMSAQQLITDAGRNVFEAKRLGRNRMVAAATKAA
jgi:PleD family two-component response regulator